MKIRMAIGVAGVMLAAIWAANAEPASISGNEWAADCKNKSDAIVGLCNAYVRGFGDGLFIWQQVSPSTAKICIPNKATGEQLRDVGVRYIAQHPEKRHLSVGELLAIAYLEAWPCKGDGK